MKIQYMIFRCVFIYFPCFLFIFQCGSAHICYICSGDRLSKQPADARMVLLTGNHKTSSRNNWISIEPLQLTEIFEASKKKADEKYTLPYFQVNENLFYFFFRFSTLKNADKKYRLGAIHKLRNRTFFI
jgi:hypothetical protein